MRPDDLAHGADLEVDHHVDEEPRARIVDEPGMDIDVIASGERPLTVARGTMRWQGSPGRDHPRASAVRHNCGGQIEGTATPGRTIAPTPTEPLREKSESAAVVSNRGSCFDTGIDDESKDLDDHDVELRELFGELDRVSKEEFFEMNREILNVVSALGRSTRK